MAKKRQKKDRKILKRPVKFNCCIIGLITAKIKFKICESLE